MLTLWVGLALAETGGGGDTGDTADEERVETVDTGAKAESVFLEDVESGCGGGAAAVGLLMLGVGGRRRLQVDARG